MADSAKLSSLMSNSASWTLGQDEGLLAVLQETSQNILSRTTEVLARIDKLALTANNVQIKLETANNNLLLLSNTKFVEARVYDEADEIAEDVNDTKETVTPSEDDQISEALKLGLNLVDTAYEKVSVDDSDSDSEGDGSKQVYMLQPINSYHTRQLPAIIGTSEWFDDDHIGLADSEANKDEESESESEEEDVTDQIHAAAADDDGDESQFSDSDQETPKPVAAVANPSLAPTVVAIDNDDDPVSDFSDDDDLFRPAAPNKPPTKIETLDTKAGNDSDESEAEDSKEPIGTRSFADELASKIGGVPMPKPSLNSKDKDKSSSPEDGEKGDVILPPKQSKPVAAKSVLFGSDSDSDDDLFSGNVPLPKKAAVPKQLPDKKREDEMAPLPLEIKPEPKLSSQEPKSTSEPVTTSKKHVNQQPKSKSLFLESSDDEDFFADFKIPSQTKSVEPKTDETKKSNIFEDDSDSDDIFADLGKGIAKEVPKVKDPDMPANKPPVGGVSLFGGINPLPLFKGAKSDSDNGNDEDEADNDDSDDEDIFSNQTKKEESKIKETETPVLKPVEGVSVFSGINPLPKVEQEDSGRDQEETGNDSDNDIFTPEKKIGGTEVSNTAKNFLAGTNDAVENDKIDPINIDASLDNIKPLDTVTKSRPRARPGRRPPTKAGRKKVEEISVFGALTDQDEVQTDIGSTETIEEEPQRKKAPIGGVSLFGGFNPAEVLKLKKPAMDRPDINEKGAINSTPDDFTEASISQNEEAEADNVFSPEPPPMEVINKDDVKDIFADSDSDDDIFGDLVGKTKAPGNLTNTNMFSFDQEEDDDDDLFSSLMK